MKNLGNAFVLGGIIVFVGAILLRLLDLQPLIANPVSGLWKVSVLLLLTAIAIGVNK